MPFTTFADLLDHAHAYLGANPDRPATAGARRAVQTAYQTLPTRHPWKHLQTIGRIVTVAPYSTGTVEYDHTGGTYERQVTLTGGAWPAWAADGVLVINDVPYDVSARKSGTVLTLPATQNPGDDVAAGTSYTLYRDTYEMPTDYMSGDRMVLDTCGSYLLYKDGGDFAGLRRRNTGPAKPETFSVAWGQGEGASLSCRFWPAPDAVYPVDFQYKRRPRSLALDRIEAGTVSVTASSATVTGVGTAFTAAMIGSVIRVAYDGTTSPTGLDGASPYAEERVIESVTSRTSLGVSEAFAGTLSAVKYVISDPADIDPDATGPLLLREIERQCRLGSRLKAVDGEEAEYRRELDRARAADNRYTGPQAAGASGFYGRLPLRYHPAGTEFQ